MKKLPRFVRMMVLFLFFLIIYPAHPQSTTTKSGKNYFSASIAYPFFRTYTFGYARTISKNGFIRLNASIQPISKKDSYEHKMLFMFYFDINKQRVFTSKSLSVGYGYFILPKVGFYLAADITYRYNYFENKYYYQCAGTSLDSKVSLLSEYHHEYGLQNIAGIKLPITKYKEIRIVADFNIGLGIYWSDQKHLLIADRRGTCSSTDLQYYEKPIESHVVKVTTIAIISVGLGIGF